MQLRDTGIRALAWLLIGASALLIAPSAVGRFGQDGDFEVLIGHYYCSAGGGNGYLWVQLEGTGDIAPKRGYVQRSILYSGSAAETCDGEAGSMLALVQGFGCGVSSMRSRDADGATRQLDFVCSGERATVIQHLAAVSSQILGVSP